MDGSARTLRDLEHALRRARSLALQARYYLPSEQAEALRVVLRALDRVAGALADQRQRLPPAS